MLTGRRKIDEWWDEGMLFAKWSKFEFGNTYSLCMVFGIPRHEKLSSYHWAIFQTDKEKDCLWNEDEEWPRVKRWRRNWKEGNKRERERERERERVCPGLERNRLKRSHQYLIESNFFINSVDKFQLEMIPVFQARN